VHGLSDPSVGTETQIAAGVRAAGLLARGREEGLRFVLLSEKGAARSFWAGAICLIPFLLIRAMGGDTLVSDALPAQMIGYVLGWVAFPLAALSLVDASGRGPLWPLFVAAWNWANLAQYAALLGAALLGLVLPPEYGRVLILAAFAYALWIEWFVAKAALGITGFRAGLFVMADMAIGLFIASVVTRLSGG